MAAGSLRFPARQARDNHARILAAAREELGRDPDASLDEIARAARVVRRTVYGHFPNRRALIAALAAEATAILERGQHNGTFATDLPGPVLALALDSLALALLESQASTGWSDPTGEAAATTILIAAGVTPASARRYVHTARHEDPLHSQSRA